jgi:hypothetical protein
MFPISRSDTHTYVELRFTIRGALRTIALYAEVRGGEIGGWDELTCHLILLEAR